MQVVRGSGGFRIEFKRVQVTRMGLSDGIMGSWGTKKCLQYSFLSLICQFFIEFLGQEGGGGLTPLTPLPSPYFAISQL